MTYGSGLEFSWRGFRFCAFLFLFDSIRPTWQGSNSTSFFFFLSLLYIYSILFVSLRIFGYIYFFFVFFFVSDLLVLETPPGQSAERFSAPCELAVRPWPIRNEPDDGGLCVCVQRTASDGVMTRDWMQNFLDESATVSEIVPVQTLLLTNS